MWTGTHTRTETIPSHSTSRTGPAPNPNPPTEFSHLVVMMWGLWIWSWTFTFNPQSVIMHESSWWQQTLTTSVPPHILLSSLTSSHTVLIASISRHSAATILSPMQSNSMPENMHLHPPAPARTWATRLQSPGWFCLIVGEIFTRAVQCFLKGFSISNQVWFSGLEISHWFPSIHTNVKHDYSFVKSRMALSR